MTHPAYYTVDDAIEALNIALSGEQLTIIQLQVLTDLRDDLQQLNQFDTIAEAVELATDKHKQRAFY